MPAKPSTVKADTLHCSRCHAWLPDRFFKRHGERTARRYRASHCRACEARAYHVEGSELGKYQGPFVSIFSPWTNGAKPTACSPGPLTRIDG